MKMKRTKHDLKREFKNEIHILKSAIKAWCYGCNGYGIDGVEDCGVRDCPLYGYRVKRGDCNSKKYKAVFNEMEKIKDNRSQTSRDHWDRFLKKINLAIKTGGKKVNLPKKGAVDDRE